MSRGLVEIIGSIFAGRRKGETHAPHVELKLPGGGEAAGIYARNPHSSILASVLASPAGAGAGARPTGRAPSNDSRPAPLSKTVRVGDEMRKAREALLASGEELAALSDPTTAAYIRRLLAMVEAQHCSIAFIGQMNAGKSSLINAFVGSPKLLPTEITPWTTVVTNLYFGIPKQPTGGALFEFFNPSEWQQLAEGSARVRALTEQLMPNFPWDAFYRQVGNMKEKAQEKLGARYGELLGKQHAVPVVTLDVLEKYIAAESPLGDEDGSAAGEFSMITKAAHLYFDLASFFYPTVVIDTPGINDPFLVRDEITRQNLERANVFVIVVTARQPLSNADLDLLRILRGLRKDNIVIFVNKSDELGDEAGHAGAIQERIRVLLKKEFPGANIPIIMGSALWAEIALGDDIAEKREVAGAAAPDAQPAADHIEGRSLWFSDEVIEDDRLTDRLLMRSGVTDLAVAVSEMLRSGTIAASITYAAGVLAGMARNGAVRAAENATVAERLARGESETTAAISTRVERAAGILSDIEARIEALADSLDAVLRQHLASFPDRLNATVTTAIADWRAEQNAAPGKQGGARLGALSVRLRSALEKDFLAAFQDTLQQTNALCREAERALLGQLATAAEVLQTSFEHPELLSVASSPSLAALGDPVATDLGGLLQGQLSGTLSSPEKFEAMQSILATEFGAMVEKLSRSAQDELQRSTGFFLDQIGVTVRQALRTTIEDQRRLLALPAASDGVHGAAQAEREKAETLAKLSKELAQAAVSS